MKTARLRRGRTSHRPLGALVIIRKYGSANIPHIWEKAHERMGVCQFTLRRTEALSADFASREGAAMAHR